MRTPPLEDSIVEIRAGFTDVRPMESHGAPCSEGRYVWFNAVFVLTLIFFKQMAQHFHCVPQMKQLILLVILSDGRYERPMCDHLAFGAPGILSTFL